MKRFFTVLIGISLCCFPLASSGFCSEGGRWSYSGEFGPENWFKADPAFSLCGGGDNQAPIDIVPLYDVALPLLKLNYSHMGSDLLNNGHTVQAPFPEGNTLTIGGENSYSLAQVHFHTPSENTVAGQSFPMEAHFVHTDSEGKYLVLAVFFKEGAKNAGVELLWKSMPQAATRTARLSGPFDPMSILPADLDYFYFNGSLTTPPCSEGVRWCVLKTPVTVSKDQAKALRKILKGPNNRPVQPVNARVVLQ